MFHYPVLMSYKAKTIHPYERKINEKNFFGIVTMGQR